MMTNVKPDTRLTTFAFSVALFFLLVSCYFLIYRGKPISQDAQYIIDSAESFVHRGNFSLTYMFYYGLTEPALMSRIGSGNMWRSSPQEPLSVVLASPLFLLAQKLPQIGTIHLMWLQNMFITALTGVSLFWGALWLGVSRRTAWLWALVFGLTTLAMPYSRFLFREPAVTLCLFWSVVAAIHSQREMAHHHMPYRSLLVCIVAFMGAVLFKEVSLVLFPGLLILLFPPLHSLHTHWRKLILTVFLGGIVLVVMFTLFAQSDSSRFSIRGWTASIHNLLGYMDILVESLLGYQVSFSRSIWLHSPILLIGIYGAWKLLKQGQWRIVVGVAVMVIALSASTTSHLESWWGNLGWGPRYLLPMTPILMLWVLPVMQEGLKGTMRLAFIVLAILGFVMQVASAFVPMSNYYTDMYFAGVLPELNQQTQWGAYNWTWEYSPLRYHITRFQFHTTDFAWYVANPRWVAPLLTLVLMGAIGVYALSLWRGRTFKAWGHLLIAFALTTCFIGTVSIGLMTLRDDPRYTEEFPDVYELIQQLNEQVTPQQAVVIDRPHYMEIFMNYFKVPAFPVMLPYAPGENYSGEGAVVMSDNPVEQIGLGIHAIHWTVERYPQTWLVVSSSPFETDKIRPVERYYATNYYPIEEINISYRARAIHYYTLDSREIQDYLPVDALFDEALLLSEIALPDGLDYQAGDVLPITLLWQVEDTLGCDCNVAIMLTTLEGVVVEERHTQPQGTFGNMQQWQIGETYADNHGLLIPSHLSEGEYRVMVVVYRWQDGQRLLYGLDGMEGEMLDIAQIRVTAP